MFRLMPVVVCVLLFGCSGASDLCTPNDCGTSCTNVATQRLTLKFGGMECSYLTTENARALVCAQQLQAYCHGVPDAGAGGGVGGGGGGGGGVGGGTGGGSGGGTAGGAGGGTAGGSGGGAGGGGAPVVITEIANNQPSIWGIAVTPTHIFWTAGDKVLKAQLDGGAQVALAMNQGSPRGIAVDATDVYWVNANGVNGTVRKVPISGGVVTVLVNGENNPWAIAVNATTVVWVSSTLVKKVPKAGGAAITLAVGPGQSLVLDATSAYWATQGGASPGKISRVGLASGPSEILLSTDAGLNPLALAIDADHVYWTDQNNVSRLPLDGGAFEVLAPSANSGEIAVDSSHVYWTNYNTDGGLLSVPKAGGAMVPIARTAFTSSPLAQDATRLYWAAGGNLLSVAK